MRIHRNITSPPVSSGPFETIGPTLHLRTSAGSPKISYHRRPTREIVFLFERISVTEQRCFVSLNCFTPSWWLRKPAEVHVDCHRVVCFKTLHCHLMPLHVNEIPRVTNNNNYYYKINLVCVRIKWITLVFSNCFFKFIWRGRTVGVGSAWMRETTEIL
jgi:hypothetical protein